MDETGHGQGRVHREERIVAVDRHPQLGSNVGHLHADGAQADHAQALSHELRTHELGLALLHHGLNVASPGDLGVDPLGAGGHVPGCHNEGAHGQLLDGVGVGAGGVEHHDARLGAAGHRDVVGARPRPGNGPQGVGERIFLHVRRADQDAVLVLFAVGNGVTGLVQGGQTGGGNLIQSLDTEHI